MNTPEYTWTHSSQCWRKTISGVASASLYVSARTGTIKWYVRDLRENRIVASGDSNNLLSAAAKADVKLARADRNHLTETPNLENAKPAK